MLQPKVTPWCSDKGVPIGVPVHPLQTPCLDIVMDGHYGDKARKWCESIINPTYENIFPTDVVDSFDWGGIPIRVMRTLGIRRVKEQIWKWYREKGCSDAVVELVFMINTHDSFKYYVKHICEYICGGKWLVQRVPYALKVVNRIESCATTIRNELYDIIMNDTSKKQMGLFDDWQILHAPMQIVEVSPNCQGKHVDIVDVASNPPCHVVSTQQSVSPQQVDIVDVASNPKCHIRSQQQRRGGYTPC